MLPQRVPVYVILLRELNHTYAHFGPHSPLPKLPFWTQFRPMRPFLKSLQKHIS